MYAAASHANATNSHKLPQPRASLASCVVCARCYTLADQYADATLWQDPSSGEAYVYWRTRVNPHDTGFRAMRLTDDCLDVDPSSDTQLFHTPNREAPAVFIHFGHVYLWTSGTWGWSPCANFQYRSTGGPLGPFNASLGHTWHTYSKPPAFNRSAMNYEQRDGYLSGGDDWIPERRATRPQSEALCAASTSCAGFSFIAPSPVPPASQMLTVSFKTTSRHFVPDDAFGLQPPAIPSPGHPGNRKEDGQPGIWSFDSQSTYILPNPQYKPGSKLPQFIYIADRWTPSGKSSFGTYVWLPLFFDEQQPTRNARITWHSAWRLDNVTSPFAVGLDA